jgi:hypothetical protein
VVHLLGDREPSIPFLANAVEEAADRSLADALNDPGFVEALWLLLKIPKAAKSTDFATELAKIGIKVSAMPTFSELLGAFDRALERARLRSYRKTTDFSVLARNAAISALHGALQSRLPTLWSATAEDERTSLATLITTESFGDLAQGFFANLLDRHIHYFLDRETPRHFGSESFAHSIADTIFFNDATRLHCNETAVIVRIFAKEWLGKNGFHLQKEITRDDVRGFASHAITKVRNELAERGARQ